MSDLALSPVFPPRDQVADDSFVVVKQGPPQEMGRVTRLIELPLKAGPAPAAPAAGGLKTYALEKTGKETGLVVRFPDGREWGLQEDLSEFQTFRYQPASFSSLLAGDGTMPILAVGTATAQGVQQGLGLVQSRPRIRSRVGTAAVNAIAGFRASNNFVTVGRDASCPGGFYYRQAWATDEATAPTTRRAFCGMTGSVVAPTDVDPSTLTDGIWMGWDTADTNIQMMHNDAAGVATKIDLGASFPKPSAALSAIYQIELFSPNSLTQSVSYRVVRFNITANTIAAEATGTITTNLPAVTTLLGHRVWASAGGTSTTIGVSLFGIFVRLGY